MISHWIWNRVHTDSFPQGKKDDLDDQLVTIQTDMRPAPVLEFVIGMVLLILYEMSTLLVLWKRFQNG